MSESFRLTEEERKGILITTGTVNPELAQDIADNMGVELVQRPTWQYGDTEIDGLFDPRLVHGRDMYIVQPTARRGDDFSAQDAFMELAIMTKAARSVTERSVNLVIPYYGYGRQDHAAEEGMPITGSLVADFLKLAGASSLTALDLHAPQIQAFFPGKFDALTSYPILCAVVGERIAAKNNGEFAAVALSAKEAKTAKVFAEVLDIDFIQLDVENSHTFPEVFSGTMIKGRANNRHCFVVGHTISRFRNSGLGCIQLLEAGANTVDVVSPHGQFVDDALENIAFSGVGKIIVTDSLPHHHVEVELADHLIRVPIGPMIARSLVKTIRLESLSGEFGFFGHI